jgi:serine/threonine-protein kinase
VIHRDIKPDNIQLTVQTDRAHRVPKVLDFGISKVPDADGLSLTRTGTTMGTPMYMSYEQLCGVKDIDVRTDVYAFGVVLYEALTGLPPYPAANLPQLVSRLAHTVPTPPRQLRPEIPEALDALIQRAIDAGQLPPVPPDVLFRIMLAPVHGAAVMRLCDRLAPGEDADAIARDTLEAVLTGLRAGSPVTSPSAGSCHPGTLQ